MQKAGSQHKHDADRAHKQGPSAPTALLTGAIIGAIGGAIIGVEAAGSTGAAAGAGLGAVVYGLAEWVSHVYRRRGEAKSELYRIPAAVFFGALVGSLVALGFGNSEPLLFGVAFGSTLGAIGFVALLAFRSNRLILGTLAGLIIGGLAEAIFADASLAVIAALTVLLYRIVGAAVFKGKDIAALAAEAVHADEAKFVVPFESTTKQVGAEFFKDLARTSDGSFKRNAPGIGIVESLSSLQGPTFDPNQVHPLIQEFYEHTSRFTLSIVPQWKLRMKPAYWLFKKTVAQRIGQANLPMDTEEAQSGVVSYIDVIEFESSDVVDLRAWIRAFKDSGQAIYVGIYTVVRHDGVGYVSVGFPLPKLNFTVTLRPYNNRESDLLLKTHDTNTSFTGHYLTGIDHEGHLTVIKLPTMSEEIDVFVKNGELRTDHRFFLSGSLFLNLQYSMVRI